MALADTVEAIIFDYGGVLVHHQTDADQGRMAKILGIPQQRFGELYWSRRAEYDRAALTADEYWRDIAQRANAPLSEAAAAELTQIDSESWMHFDEGMWDWIGQLRHAKKRLGILSNMPRELGEALKTRTTRFQGFEEVTLSYEVGLAKPAAAIYRHCLHGLGSQAESTLFLDDRIENIEAAEALGIRAVQFLDRDEVLRQVR